MLGSPARCGTRPSELLQQRVFGLCRRLRRWQRRRPGRCTTHYHKLMVGRDPLAGLGLASQPPRCRASRTQVTARELPRHDSRAWPDTVIAQQRRRLHGRGHADHARSGSHRLPDPRSARVRVLQRPLRHLVLPAGRGHGDLQRRANPVPGGHRAAAGQRPGQPWGDRPVALAAPGAAAGLPPRHPARPARMAASPARRLLAYLDRAGVGCASWACPAMPAWTSASGACAAARGSCSAPPGRPPPVFGETRYAARELGPQAPA